MTRPALHIHAELCHAEAQHTRLGDIFINETKLTPLPGGMICKGHRLRDGQNSKPKTLDCCWLSMEAKASVLEHLCQFDLTNHNLQQAATHTASELECSQEQVSDLSELRRAVQRMQEQDEERNARMLGTLEAKVAKIERLWDAVCTLRDEDTRRYDSSSPCR